MLQFKIKYENVMDLIAIGGIELIIRNIAYEKNEGEWIAKISAFHLSQVFKQSK